jgi:copper chaperone CopZ
VGPSAVVLLAGLAIAPAPVRAHGGGPRVPAALAGGGPQRITVTVTGLSCPFCAYGLEKRLRRLEGLDSLHIEFQSGQVALYLRDGSKVGDQEIRRLVTDAGFEARKIERVPLPPAS